VWDYSWPVPAGDHFIAFKVINNDPGFHQYFDFLIVADLPVHTRDGGGRPKSHARFV
jgi:hypothetical protein